jgi:ubiquinone biosynthesis protein COQ9
MVMATAPLPADPTLDEIREALAPRLAAHAAFDGWSDRAVAAAAAEQNVDPDIAKLALQGGPMELIEAWIGSVDAEMARRLPADMLNVMKIRQRITALITTRLEIAAPDREGQRRSLAIMAMPQNLAASARIGWRSADRMWRLAGDSATDFNHYTKRVMLSAVYASTLAIFVNDESENFSETRAFLDRRIENVMQFETLKAQAKSRQAMIPSLSRFIGRFRYPPR